jgi:hypothetical protein
MDPFEMRNVVVDCAEPRELADFYRAAFGWEYLPGHEEDDPAGDDWLQLRPPLLRSGVTLMNARTRTDPSGGPWPSR